MKNMVSTQEAASAPERLHRWKENVHKKQLIQVAEQAERKRQEDNYFVAMRSRVMSVERVQLAAERNHEVAKEMARKKMQLKTQRERELMDEDECTFQPQLFMPARAKLAKVRSKYRENATNATSQSGKVAKSSSGTAKQRKSMMRPESNAVFERLYAMRKQTNQSEDEQLDSQGSHERARLDLDKVEEFVTRQLHFQRVKEKKLVQLEEDTRCSFSPELSERTKQLSLARRAKPVSELLHDERIRRQRKLERCIGRDLSFERPSSPAKKPASIASHVFQAPEAFQALLLDLQAQEARMKALDLHNGLSLSSFPATGSPVGYVPPAACTPSRCPDSCGSASSAQP